MKTTRTLLIAAMTTVGLALTQPVSADHHHEHIAMNTEKKLINIELDVLLEKFAELTKRVHQLDLERISMEAEIDFESNEAEQAEISRHVKRISVFQDLCSTLVILNHHLTIKPPLIKKMPKSPICLNLIGGKIITIYNIINKEIIMKT